MNASAIKVAINPLPRTKAMLCSNEYKTCKHVRARKKVETVVMACSHYFPTEDVHLRAFCQERPAVRGDVARVNGGRVRRVCGQAKGERL